MHFTRRDLLGGVSTIAIAAALPEETEAFWHGVVSSGGGGGGGSPGTVTGKNLISLEGGANYSMNFIFANWWKRGTDETLNVTCANKITAITASQPTSAVTITIGSPTLLQGSFANTLSPDISSFVLTADAGSTLPTGLVSGNTYFVRSNGYLPGMPFAISSTASGPLINTSGTQSGTFTGTGQWTALAQTSAPHGLFMTGGNAVTNNLGPRNTVFPLAVSGASPAGYNHAGTFTFDCVVTDTTHFSYPLTSNPGPFTSGTATLSYVVTGSGRVNDGGGAWLDSNYTFLDANGDVQPNIPLATSITLSKLLHQVGGVGYLPFGYSRVGQTFTQAYTPLGSSTPITADFPWVAGFDTFFNVTLNIDIVHPPRNIYIGVKQNYAPWVAALASRGANPVTGSNSFFDPASVAMLKAGCGILRFMDWQGQGAYGIGQFSQIPPIEWNYWATGPQYMSPFAFGMPLEPMVALANECNKHPWIHVPPQFGTTNQYMVVATKSNPLQIGFSWKHNYSVGDVITVWNDNGTGGGMINGAGLFGPSTGFGQRISITSDLANNRYNGIHAWLPGQPVVFDLNINGLLYMQTYFVCNPTPTTFQVALTYADATASTPIPITLVTGTNGQSTVASTGLNRMYLKVTAVSDYYVTIGNMNSAGFGNAPTPYPHGNPFTAETFCGNVTSLMDWSKQATEVTTWANAIKSRLNAGLIPHFQVGNEFWNTRFPVSFWLYAQSQNLVDPVTKIKIFTQEDNNKIAGYLYSNAMNTIRTVFGGGARGVRPWRGMLGVKTSDNGDTQANLTGILQWITSNASSLTVPDLVDDLALTCYYNGSSAAQAADSFAVQNASVSAASPSLISHAIPTGFVLNSMWPGQPISFNTFGTFPTDLATGQPLQIGTGSTSVAFRGTISGNTLTILNVPGDLNTGDSPQLNFVTPGMTIFGTATTSAGAPFGGMKDVVLLPFGTGGTSGTGTTGTYAVVGPSQTISTSTQMSGFDLGKNAGVYYSMGGEDGFPYTSNLVIFTGSTSGNVLTVSSTFQGTVAVGQYVWCALNEQSGVPGNVDAISLPGLAVAGGGNPGTTITADLGGGNFRLSTTPSIALPAGTNFGSGFPVNCQSGTGNTNQNAVFTGTISGSVLTVNSSPAPVGVIEVNQYIQDNGNKIKQVIQIASLGTGTGGAGTYNLTSGSAIPSIPTAEVMTSGYHSVINNMPAAFVRWISDSIALGPAPLGNGTNPSAYTEWNRQANYEIVHGPRGANRIIGSHYQWSLHAQKLMFPPNGGASLIPAVGISFYEGSWGNDISGRDPSGLNAQVNPAFIEFWGTAIRTIEDANNWTQMVAMVNSLPGYVNIRQGFTVPSNLRMGSPAQFVDAVGPFYVFNYGAVQTVDTFLGPIAPTWQNLSLAQPGPKWLAVLATN